MSTITTFGAWWIFRAVEGPIGRHGREVTRIVDANRNSLPRGSFVTVKGSAANYAHLIPRRERGEGRRKGKGKREGGKGERGERRRERKKRFAADSFRH